MPKPTDIVTTTIEDEVVFMTNPKVDFVSLVKHGANRAPFKVLKSDKGGTNMNRVVQAILVRNDLPEDKVKEILADFKADDMHEFDSFNSYVQAEKEIFEPDSLGVASIEDGVFHVVGVMKEDKADEDLQKVDKQVGTAGLDDLYRELYAMADVVSGAMRQESAEPEFRANTILTAIDNFKAFAAAVLENSSKFEAVKLEDHPTLIYPLVKTEEDNADVDPDPEADADPDADAAAAAADADAGDPDPLKVIADGLKGLTDSIGELVKRVGALEEAGKKVTEQVEGIEKSVEEVQSTVKTSHAAADEDPEPEEEKKGWGGVIFPELRKQA